MDWLIAIVLGALQGATEFLPISSSAHLRIAGELLPGAEDPGATFTAITQIGTELAVVLFFWRDISRIIGKWFGSFTGRVGKYDPDVKMGWLVIIGTVPIAIAGVVAQDLIRDQWRSLWITATVLIAFGIVLGLADMLGRRVKTLETTTYPDGILIGLAQMLALIPGVSRSGATTSMGRALGYERPAAAKYAFFLAVPAVFGAGFYETAQAIAEPSSVGLGWGPTIAATVVAFVVGLAVIKFLMDWISRRSFLPFVLYRIALGAALLIALSAGWIEAL
ncbi:undecaprenyl-diphosphate phosphatase [Agrococcus sp. HG114]|uniref:undecaprenyl-diphosphate phosphatase n=1 Tax=Agrococcus sp. HG114 TaxID=2969757 RepID=UPI00215A126C|nr:undecaprenyl-diphosphate phosphatase [Agrococcus sp. HG114]MCR8669702.1 undecaprenyl-diphosphate phosphatase [Agrococcus sp. HG114]